jgi:hypothetical protein
MRESARGSVALGLFLCLTAFALADRASACGTGEILFEDRLQPPDISWGLVGEDPSRSFTPAGVSWTVEPNIVVTRFNEASLYEDFELCIDAAITYPKDSDGWIGLTFWGVDKQNTYYISLFPAAGEYAVFRLQNNKLLKPVPYTKAEAIKIESGAINHLSIAVKGNQVTVTINDTKVTEFKGIPPKGGGLVGLDLGSGELDPEPSTFTFANFQVRALAE